LENVQLAAVDMWEIRGKLQNCKNFGNLIALQKNLPAVPKMAQF
jgi:hypothetical protein